MSCAVGFLKRKGCVCVYDYMCMYMSILPIYSVYDFTLLVINSSSLAQSVSWGKDCCYRQIDDSILQHVKCLILDT